MKVSELKQIIKEEIVKALAENESKPTHRSNVDWYYIEEYSDYPGPKGRTVPNARGYEDPTGYDGTSLYVPEGTVGYVDGDKFIVTSGKRKGNDVEYKAEYFDKISENQVNEGEGDLITLLYSLDNSINDNDKQKSKAIINQLLSIARDIEDKKKNS
jgi:hypothetical protein